MRRWGLFFLLLLLIGCRFSSESEAATAVPHPTSVLATAVPASPTPEPTVVPLGVAAERIWQRPFGLGLKGAAAFGAERVFVATDTAVVALDPATGDTVWEATLPDGVWSRSLAANDTAVVVGSPGQIMALNPNDGRILWQQPVVGNLLWAPLLSEDMVYAGTAFVGPGVIPDPDGKAWVYAVDLVSGAVVWSWETAVYTLTTPTSNGEQLFVGGSFLDAESDVDEGGFLRLHAFDLATGDLLWQAERQDGFIKSLAANEDTLFLLAYTDMLYGLDGRSGEVVWQYPTENWSPGFTFQDNVLYFGSDNAFVHAVDGRSGTAVWRSHLEGIFNAPRADLALDETTAYFQGNDNQIYALNLADGRFLWQTIPQPRSRVPLTLGGGMIFLVDQEGTLSTFQIP